MNWLKGSKWRKWDLHVHSPASHAFAGDWNQFIIQLGNADCDVVGIMLVMSAPIGRVGRGIKWRRFAYSRDVNSQICDML